MHGPGVRIAGAHARFLLGFFSALACLPLLQLFQRTRQSLLLLASRAHPGLLYFRTALLVPRITHLRYAPSRFLPMLANRLLLEITSTARQGLNLRAVLHHLLQRDQPFLAQRCQHLRESFIEFLLLLHTEIRQRVVVHFLQSRQPLEGPIVLTAPGHFSCRTEPLAIGIHPHTDQQLRINRRPSTFFCTALDGLIKGDQVQATYQCPNGSGRMVFADEFLHIHGSPAHLLAVHVANQRLFAERIFLAHAASPRQTFYFARWKFGGFLHSFKIHLTGVNQDLGRFASARRFHSTFGAISR